MANKYLLPVYSFVFDEAFSYSSFDHRLKMQKVIYLLQELGVPVSDYGFSWYKHGPYSQALLDDAYCAREETTNLSLLSLDNKRALDTLKKSLSKPSTSPYSAAEWCECIASLHFLLRNILPSQTNDDELINALTQRKPHLHDKFSNCEAARRVHMLFD